MIAAGVNPDEIEIADRNPSRLDCYACHQIHNSYTTTDWALRTTALVTIYALEDSSFDGGMGNLCAKCHQPRRVIAEEDGDGNINVTSTSWGPHHSPQATLLMGLGGAGNAAEGKPSGHYSMVEDTCVSCHLGDYDDHSFEPQITTCRECHADIDNFDFSGFQTDVEKMLAELGKKLEAEGMYELNGNYPVVGVYEAAKAQALWNYIYVAVEDGSLGVHNPAYTKALLEWSLDVMK